MLGAVLAAVLPAAATPLAPGLDARWERFHTLSRSLQQVTQPAALGGADCRASVDAAPGVGAAGSVASCERPAATAAEDGDQDGAQAASRLEAAAVVHTPGGLMALAELPGVAPGAYVRVYGYGNVAATGADGDVLWTHSSRTFTRRSGVGLPDPNQVSHVYVGTDPLDPFVTAGEDPFAVGDLTGDGAADVAVAHFLPAGSRKAEDWSAFVSVLDGRTGEFVWSHLYPGRVVNLAIAGRTLVLGVETGEPRNNAGAPGSRSFLAAWRFDTGSGQATATPAWSVNAVPWARWLSLEVVGGDRIAAAWTATPVGTAADARGRVLVVSTASGTVSWSEETSGYPRILRHDAAGNRLVALEQDDPVVEDELRYAVVARSLDDGRTLASARRDSAVALSLQVADVEAGGAQEWVVGDVATTSLGACPAPDLCLGLGGLSEGRVTALDADSGEAVWTRVGQREANLREGLPSPLPFGLLVRPGSEGDVVVVGSLMPWPKDTQLEALDVTSGTVVWSRRDGNLLQPMFLAPYRSAGRQAVLTATSRPNLYGSSVGTYVSSVGVSWIHPDRPYQVVSAWDVESGEIMTRNPVLGDVYAAVGVPVDGDGVTDLVVGGESGAVFALNGARLGDDPDVLWRTPVSGQVRRIELADVDGDGTAEVVVAASRSVDVLDSETGDVRWSAPYPDAFVWTVAVGDVDGDELPDVVVPSQGLDAYRGTDGGALWRFDPPESGLAYFGTSVVTDDQRVVTQYLGQPAAVADPVVSGDVLVPPGNQHAAVIDGRSGEPLWVRTQRDPRAAPDLWKGVAVGRMQGVDGDGAAFTWDESLPDLAWRARTDVYDLDSGDLAYSATSPDPSSNFGTTLLPGAGVQQYNFGASVRVTPDGAVPNLDGMLPTDVAPVHDGGLASVAVSQWPSSVLLLDPADLSGGRVTSPRSHWSAGLSVGATRVQDLDGDGTDEIIGFPFDWAGYSGSQMPAGRHSFAIDVISHALVVLRQSP